MLVLFSLYVPNRIFHGSRHPVKWAVLRKVPDAFFGNFRQGSVTLTVLYGFRFPFERYFLCVSFRVFRFYRYEGPYPSHKRTPCFLSVCESRCLCMSCGVVTLFRVGSPSCANILKNFDCVKINRVFNRVVNIRRPGNRRFPGALFSGSRKPLKIFLSGEPTVSRCLRTKHSSSKPPYWRGFRKTVKFRKVKMPAKPDGFRKMPNTEVPGNRRFPGVRRGLRFRIRHYHIILYEYVVPCVLITLLKTFFIFLWELFPFFLYLHPKPEHIINLKPKTR